MENISWISKWYSLYSNKNLFTKPVYFQKPISIKVPKNKIYDLSEFIINQQKYKVKNKTLLDMLNDEKLNTNKQISQIKLVDIVSFGSVIGIALLAFYTYSGYKFI
jgi:hypothetical protein